MGGISGESCITDIDQNRGRSSHLGTKGLDKYMMCEAKHKAGPRRCRGFWVQSWASTALGPRGGLGGPGVVFTFVATLAKDAHFLPFFLPVFSAITARETRSSGAGEGAGSVEGAMGCSVRSIGTLESSWACILPFSKGHGDGVQM